MAPLTWRNVDAPNFSDSNALFDKSSTRVEGGLRGLGAAGKGYFDSQVVAGSKQALANMATFTDSEAWAGALKNGGSTAGLNSMYVNEAALGQINNKRSALLGDDSTILNMEAHALKLAGGAGGTGGGGGSRSRAGTAAANKEEDMALLAGVNADASNTELLSTLGQDGAALDVADGSLAGAVGSGNAAGTKTAGEVRNAAANTAVGREISADAQRDEFALAEANYGVDLTEPALPMKPDETAVAARYGVGKTAPNTLSAPLDLRDPATIPQETPAASAGASPMDAIPSFSMGEDAPTGKASVPPGSNKSLTVRQAREAGQSPTLSFGADIPPARFTGVRQAREAGPGNAATVDLAYPTAESPTVSFGADIPPARFTGVGQASLGYFSPKAQEKTATELETLTSTIAETEQQIAAEAAGNTKPYDPTAMEYLDPEQRQIMSDYTAINPETGKSAYGEDMLTMRANKLAEMKAQKAELEAEAVDAANRSALQEQLMTTYPTREILQRTEDRLQDDAAAIDRAKSMSPTLTMGSIAVDFQDAWNSGSGEEIEKRTALATALAKQLTNGAEVPGNYVDNISKRIAKYAKEFGVKPSEAAALIYMSKERDFQSSDIPFIPGTKSADKLFNWLTNNDINIDEATVAKLGENYSGAALMREATEIGRKFRDVSTPYSNARGLYSLYQNGMPPKKDKDGNDIPGTGRPGAKAGAPDLRGKLQTLVAGYYPSKSARETLIELGLYTDPDAERNAAAAENAKPVLQTLQWDGFQDGSNPRQQQMSSDRQVARNDQVQQTIDESAIDPEASYIKALLKDGVSAGSPTGMAAIEQVLPSLVMQGKLTPEVGEWLASNPKAKDAAFDTFQQAEDAGNQVAVPDKLMKDYMAFRAENPSDLDQEIVGMTGVVLSPNQLKKALSDRVVMQMLGAFKSNRRNGLTRAFRGENQDDIHRVKQALRRAVNGD